MKCFLGIVILCVISAPVAVWSAKILFTYPISIHSHTQVFEPIIRELAERGHDVTVYAGIGPKRPMPPNVNLILSNSTKHLLELLMGDSFRTLRMQISLSRFYENMKLPKKWCEVIMQDPVYLDKIWNSGEKFDLVINSAIANDCIYGLIWRDKTPLVLVSPTGLFPWVGAAMGNPTYVASAPTIFHTSATNRMNFWQRMHNWGVVAVHGFFYNSLTGPMTAAALHHHVLDFRHSADVLANVSMVLLNTDISMDYPRPFLPNVKEIGGLHCRAAELLPRDLEQFVTKPGSKGLILFSLGSTVQGVHMPKEFRKVFADAFRTLSDYQVLWKWEADTVEGETLPPNVRLTKWLPQQDILGHPATKLFITQGGLLSMHEATFHGVPIVGLAVGSDQLLNMRRATDAGVGVALVWEELTTGGLLAAVRAVLADPRFAANVRRRSEIMRDAESPPLARAMFWIEYVLRHGGAAHLKSSAPELAWYQQNSLDVIAFVVIVPTFIIAVSVLVSVWCCKRLFSTKKTSLNKDKGKRE